MFKNRHLMGVLREEAGEDGTGEGGGGNPNPAPTPSLNDGPSDGTPVEFKDWKSHLSDEFKSEASLADFKDSKDGLNALAKSYIHTKRMVGADKLVKISDKSTPEEVDAFYREIGKPENADGYQLEVPELNNIEFDKESLGPWKEKFHELHLTPAQAQGLLNHYLTSQDTMIGENTAATSAEISKGISELQENWGDNFEGNIDMAKAAVKKFGGQEFAKFLDDTGASTHPLMIKFAYEVAKNFMDDVPNGDGRGLWITNKTQAQQEIKSLKGDPEFQKRLVDRNAPGHKEAVARWDDLFSKAYSA